MNPLARFILIASFAPWSFMYLALTRAPTAKPAGNTKIGGF